MSDYYKCEHKEPLCGHCIRALAVQHNDLERKLSESQAEARWFEGEWQEATRKLKIAREALERITGDEAEPLATEGEIAKSALKEIER